MEFTTCDERVDFSNLFCYSIDTHDGWVLTITVMSDKDWICHGTPDHLHSLHKRSSSVAFLNVQLRDPSPIYVLILRSYDSFGSLTSVSARTLLQLLPDIIVTKLSKSPKNTISETALYEYSNLDRPSVSRLEVTDLDENASSEAVTPHYDQAWSISGLFGALRYRKHNYAIYNKGEMIEYRKKHEIEEIITEYWTPSWIARRLWRLRTFKSSSGWTLCLQTYNVIPQDSLAIVYVEENNLKGLQELFSRKLASPFDCGPSGATLLHVRRTFKSA